MIDALIKTIEVQQEKYDPSQMTNLPYGIKYHVKPITKEVSKVYFVTPVLRGKFFGDVDIDVRDISSSTTEGIFKSLRQQILSGGPYRNDRVKVLAMKAMDKLKKCANEYVS